MNGRVVWQAVIFKQHSGWLHCTLVPDSKGNGRGRVPAYSRTNKVACIPIKDCGSDWLYALHGQSSLCGLQVAKDPDYLKVDKVS